MNDLETISTDDLVAELLRRHKALFLVARPPGRNGYAWRVHSTGNITDLLGMIEIGKSQLIELDKKHERERERERERGK